MHFIDLMEPMKTPLKSQVNKPMSAEKISGCIIISLDLINRIGGMKYVKVKFGEYIVNILGAHIGDNYLARLSELLRENPDQPVPY